MFESPTALLLLGIIPAFIVFFIWRERARRRAAAVLGDVELIRQLMALIPARRYQKSALWLVALAALVIALARPVWGIDEEFIEVEGIALMIVLDVSASMDAQDILPSRLERAKLAARTLYQESQGDQVGLILFAGNAIVQFPLTSDILTAQTFLNAASSESITRQGTAMEDGLRLAIAAFDERIASDMVIVLMSDGENHQGQPVLAAEEAAERGILIYAIGYGTQAGAPIPEYDAQGEVIGFKSDTAGNLVFTQLDESILAEVAEVTGGTYQPASDSGIEIIDLLNEIGELERGILERRTDVKAVERFGLFLALALLALSIEIVLPETHREQARDARTDEKQKEEQPVRSEI